MRAEQKLERVSPESVGVSSKQVRKCLENLMHERTSMNGFMAARYGKVFAEGWWKPYGPELVHSNHSLGKSYTATAIGIALQEGKLSLDECLTDIFAEEIRQGGVTVSEEMKLVTLYHVLTMSSGHAIHPPVTEDWICDYFRTPVAFEPGTRFLYNSSGSFLLGAVILKKTGQNLKEYLVPRLFEKIGIDENRFVWLKFPNGVDAEPGTFACTEDNLRLAMLYCNGGRWRGEQVIEEQFVREALKVHIATDYAPEQIDGRCGYGYQLWACSMPGVYRFDGGQGQYGIIWPEKEIVVAIHEGASVPYGPQQTLNAVYKQLFCCMKDEPLPADPCSEKELLNFQASFSMPADQPNEIRTEEKLQGRYQVLEGEMDPWMGIAPPGGNDFFRLLRRPDRDIKVKVFSLEITESNCALILDSRTIFKATMDGSLHPEHIEDVFPGLGNYCATARYINDETLEMKIHWLNSWAQTVLWFEKRNGHMHFTIRKLRLNEEADWLVTHGRATLL